MSNWLITGIRDTKSEKILVSKKYLKKLNIFYPNFFCSIKLVLKIYEGKVSKICQENTEPKIFIFELSKLPSTERAN